MNRRPVREFARLLIVGLLPVASLVGGNVHAAQDVATPPTTDPASADAPVLVDLEVQPPGEAWVGQRVSVYLTLASAVDLDGTPFFDVPALDDAILQRLPGSPLVGIERRDGIERVTRRYTFLLYPRRPGQLEIPSIGVRCSVIGDDGTGSRALRLASPASAIEARLPDGASSERALVTSPSLTFEQSWSTVETTLRVGDSIERAITLTAGDVLAIALPRAPFTEPDGLALYPAEPSLDDRAERGRLTGTRIDRATWICERPGEVVLPAIAYTWFDPDANRLERRTLEGRGFTVLPAADGNALVLSDDGASADDALMRHRSIALALAALASIAFALLMTWRRHRLAIEAWWHARVDPERAAFGELVRATRRDDRVASFAACMRWCAVRRVRGDDPMADSELRARFESLERAIVEPASASTTNTTASGHAWSGTELERAARARRRDLDARTPRERSALPGLNPRTGA